eukprot:4384234-Prymnesium_polylepis.1
MALTAGAQAAAVTVGLRYAGTQKRAGRAGAAHDSLLAPRAVLAWRAGAQTAAVAVCEARADVSAVGARANRVRHLDREPRLGEKRGQLVHLAGEGTHARPHDAPAHGTCGGALVEAQAPLGGGRDRLVACVSATMVHPVLPMGATASTIEAR